MKQTAYFLVASACFVSWSAAATSAVSLINTNTTVKDNTGTVALDAGGNPASDGDVIQVGYFSTDTSSFSGTWIPITGNGSSNTNLLTTIGDGGDATADGIFSINVTFDDSDPQRSSNLPAGGAQLALRFYNASSVASATHFNTVTDASWTFKSLSTNVQTPSLLDMDSAANLVWQDNGNPFVTSLVVPEPSTTAILGLGGLALLLRRRR